MPLSAVLNKKIASFASILIILRAANFHVLFCIALCFSCFAIIFMGKRESWLFCFAIVFMGKRESWLFCIAIVFMGKRESWLFCFSIVFMGKRESWLHVYLFC